MMEDGFSLKSSSFWSTSPFTFRDLTRCLLPVKLYMGSEDGQGRKHAMSPTMWPN